MLFEMKDVIKTALINFIGDIGPWENCLQAVKNQVDALANSNQLTSAIVERGNSMFAIQQPSR